MNGAPNEKTRHCLIYNLLSFAYSGTQVLGYLQYLLL